MQSFLVILKRIKWNNNEFVPYRISVDLFGGGGTKRLIHYGPYGSVVETNRTRIHP